MVSGAGIFPAVILPLVAHFMCEGLQQFKISGFGEEIPGIQANFILPVDPVPGHVAQVFVMPETLPLILESENAAGKLPAEQRIVQSAIALRKGDVVSNVGVMGHGCSDIVSYETTGKG
jgi:hypothetical protein